MAITTLPSDSVRYKKPVASKGCEKIIERLFIYHFTSNWTLSNQVRHSSKELDAFEIKQNILQLKARPVQIKVEERRE